LIKEPVDTPEGTSGPSRAQRLAEGWSANLVLMLLGISQQVALVPIFLLYWSSDVLAAWLTIYAVGSLVLIADLGLQLRCVNRFLVFKSSVDCDGRTARFYAAMLWIYFGLAVVLVLLVLVGTQLLPPSALLGFQATSYFDAAFFVMVSGMLLMLPSNLVSALYRTRGLYGRAVWLQSGAMLVSQIMQMVAIVATGSLLAVIIAYVATQLLMLGYLVALDAPRLFPFLRGGGERRSWRWSIGQFRVAIPFAVAGAAEIAQQYAPILLVSAFMSDRVVVAQWGLTRVIAGLLRALCYQTTLPLAAELGHDYAVGLKEQLRSLYGRGSVFVTLLASIVTSGLLAFWPDFFTLWTHNAIPYNPTLTVTVLLGTSASAPSILAFAYASYSNRGYLLVRTKGLQLVVFLILSFALIPPMGPLGAAIAIVASDLFVQFGMLGVIIMKQTLKHPFWHVAFLAAVMATVISFGWGLGAAIRSLLPWAGSRQFAAECTLWLAVVAIIASPLASASLRGRLISKIPK
jgi:O-antigen/teichoic acid export membrane protein